MSLKTSLVAGGAGFVGSHLCEALLKKGHRVIAVDSLISGRRSNLDSPIFKRYAKRFRFIKRDIIQPLTGLRADYVFSFASPASPPHYQKHAIYTLRTGSEGTRNLLELAKRCGARVLHASTSEVYGDPKVHPQREDYWGHVNPIGIRSCYDESKRYAEAMTMAFHRKHGVRTNIARIFNTYGPRMALNDGRVVPAFIDQALRGDALTIFGDGSQTRSFCYVSDLVDGLVRLGNSDERFPVNLGNPVEMTISEFAERIQRLMGTQSPIVYKNLPSDDPKQRKPDIAKAARVLGWAPKVNLEDGLRETVAYFKSRAATA